MRRFLVGSVGSLLCALAPAALPDGDSLLARVDANAGTKNKAVVARMTILGRSVAGSALNRDALKEGGGTEFALDSIRLDVKIPDYIFSKAVLRG